MTSDEDPRAGSCWLSPCWLALMASLGLIPFSLQSGNWHVADIQWIPGQTLPAPAFLTKWNVFVWNVFYSHGKIVFLPTPSHFPEMCSPHISLGCDGVSMIPAKCLQVCLLLDRDGWYRELRHDLVIWEGQFSSCLGTSWFVFIPVFH